jgi:hypothetical protein
MTTVRTVTPKDTGASISENRDRIAVLGKCLQVSRERFLSVPQLFQRLAKDRSDASSCALGRISLAGMLESTSRVVVEP